MEIVSTENAPKAVGPYSQAVVSGGTVYCSGQIPIDPATGAVVAGPADVQARRAIANLRAVLEAAGSDLAHVLKTTVFLADITDFASVNAVYAELFGDAKPARTCAAAAGLPKGAKIMIDAIAERKA